MEECTGARLLGVGFLLLLGAGASGCSRTDDVDAGRRAERRELALSPPTLLRDGAGSTLASPTVVSEDPLGRIIVTDRSDHNIKVYDAAGAPVRVLGRAGRGPGEFAVLMSAQAYRDSVLAYDVNGGRLSVFTSGGQFASARPVSEGAVPFFVRVVDDSLLLLVSAIPSRQMDGALSLVRPDGTVRSRFLDLRRYLGNNPQLASAVGLLADGANGRIFATVAGGDSVWVFDYDGRRLGAFPADPVQPLVTARSLIDANGGRIRRSQGGYVVDGNRMVISLVAMDSGTVALQIAPYDGRLGIDPEEGGTFVVSTLSGGTGRLMARQELVGFLLGRDRRDRLLLLRYSSPQAESHELVRATLVPAGGAR